MSALAAEVISTSHATWAHRSPSPGFPQSAKDCQPTIAVSSCPATQDGCSSCVKDPEAMVRLELSAATLNRLMAQGALHAADFHCLDCASKQCVRTICLKSCAWALGNVTNQGNTAR